MAIQIVITLADNGAVQIQGPIQDKMACYGLLEVAKDLVRDYEAPVVQPANGLLIGRN